MGTSCLTYVYNSNIEVDWRTDAFKKLCIGSCEEDEDNQGIKNNDHYEDTFGKIDWNLWEIENDTFGKVNWDNIESLSKWTRPEDGYCKEFKFDNVIYLRDYNDIIWSIKEGSPFDIVGRFDTKKEMIVDLDYEIEIED